MRAGPYGSACAPALRADVDAMMAPALQADAQIARVGAHHSGTIMRKPTAPNGGSGAASPWICCHGG
jgi:hypothetical protein